MRKQENNSGLVNNEMRELSSRLSNLKQVLDFAIPYAVWLEILTMIKVSDIINSSV